MPQEMRTRLSVNPIAARRSAGTEACVIVAGWLMSVSTPPRLSASAMSLTGCNVPSGLEGSGIEREHPAESAHLTFRQLVLRVVGSPG